MTAENKVVVGIFVAAIAASAIAALVALFALWSPMQGAALSRPELHRGLA